MAAALESLLDEYLRYCDRFVSEQIVERVNGLLQAGGNESYESDESERGFWLEVLARVQQRKPFSVVRLGEGEGNVLFWGAHKTSYPQLAAWSLEAIWLIMFGRPAGRREAPKVLAGMRRAVETADLLGIPWREDVRDPPGRNYILAAMDAADPAKSPSLDPTTLIRAGCGYLAVWETLAQAGLPKQGIRVGTRRVHVSFLDIAQEVLSSAGNVSLITCYPALLRAIEKAFEVLAIESLLIPPEGGSPTATADWHSDVSRPLETKTSRGVDSWLAPASSARGSATTSSAAAEWRSTSAVCSTYGPGTSLVRCTRLMNSCVGTPCTARVAQARTTDRQQAAASLSARTTHAVPRG